MTFKQRVETFWDWFRSVATEYHATIEDGRCADLQAPVSEAVDRWLGGLTWVFGPGEKEGEHSLTLSPEGVLHRQFLTDYWLAHAPALPGWRFYASRQAGEIDGKTIGIDDLKFEASAMWVSAHPNPEIECFDVTVWHPLFSKIDEDTRHTVTFLWLDELLGEHGTTMWIGAIDLADTKLRDAMPLAELAAFISRESSARGWKKLPPGEEFSVYQLPEQETHYPRSDTIGGTTKNMRLIQDFLRAEGPLTEKPVPSDVGAQFVYLATATSQLPGGKQVDARAQVENAIEREFEATRSGLVLGGAIGHQFTYIDLLLLDGENSLAALRRATTAFPFLKGATLHPFVAGTPGLPTRL